MHLPSNDIMKFLRTINDNEGLNLSESNLTSIRRSFGSDMRSMINFMQSTQHEADRDHICDESDFESVYDAVKANNPVLVREGLEYRAARGCSFKNVIRDFTDHIIRNHMECISTEFLDRIQSLVHNSTTSDLVHLRYFIEECMPLLMSQISTTSNDYVTGGSND